MPRYEERPLRSRDFANLVAEIMAAGCDISALGYDIGPKTDLAGACAATAGVIQIEELRPPVSARPAD